MSGKTRLQTDLLCVEWDVKPYTFTPVALGIGFLVFLLTGVSLCKVSFIFYLGCLLMVVLS